MQQDSVDRHIEHWQREIPDLDPLVEGVVTRMEMVLRHLRQTRRAANDFAGPESRAEEGYPGVFQFTDSTKEVALVG